MLPMRFVVARGAAVWEANPALDTYPAFRAFRRKFGDELAGEGMYAVHLVYDPASQRRENGETDIAKLKLEVGAAILRDTDLTWSKIPNPVYKTYKEEMVTSAEKILEKMQERLDRLNKVMDAWYPDQKDTEGYVKSSLAAEKMEGRYLEQYEKVMAAREADQMVHSTRAGGSLSFLEELGMEAANRKSKGEGQ